MECFFFSLNIANEKFFSSKFFLQWSVPYWNSDTVRQIWGFRGVTPVMRPWSDVFCRKTAWRYNPGNCEMFPYYGTLTDVYSHWQKKSFKSSWKWRQHGPLKRWYPATSLHGVTT